MFQMPGNLLCRFPSFWPAVGVRYASAHIFAQVLYTSLLFTCFEMTYLSAFAEWNKALCHFVSTDGRVSVNVALHQSKCGNSLCAFSVLIFIALHGLTGMPRAGRAGGD